MVIESDCVVFQKQAIMKCIPPSILYRNQKIKLKYNDSEG